MGGFRDVDEDVRRDLEIQNSLNQHGAVIEALGRSYNSVWLIHDMETQHFELYRVDNEDEHLMPTMVAKRIPRYTDAFAYYAKLVLEEDRTKFLEAITPDKVVENTRGRAVYSVPFRRVFADGTRYYQVEFIKLDLGTPELKVVVGFKDVDDKVREMRRNRLERSQSRHT